MDFESCSHDLSVYLMLIPYCSDYSKLLFKITTTELRRPHFLNLYPVHLFLHLTACGLLNFSAPQGSSQTETVRHGHLSLAVELSTVLFGKGTSDVLGGHCSNILHGIGIRTMTSSSIYMSDAKGHRKARGKQSVSWWGNC